MPAFKNNCPDCGKRFSKPSLLRRHATVHNDSKTFECPTCKKGFKQKSSLQRHLAHSHDGMKKHKCEKCTASFAQRINLLTHTQRTHPANVNQKVSYPCNHCKCIFTRLNTLNRHKTRQHGQKISNIFNEDIIVEDPHELAQCVVAQLKSLEKEISVAPKQVQMEENVVPSLGVEIMPTTIIDEAKIQATTIIDRLNPARSCNAIDVQVVKRPHSRMTFVCEHCAKEFRKSYDLIRHRRMHTKERPYSCSYCTKRFATKTKLNEHMSRIHILHEKTGCLSKIHVCIICTKSYDSLRQFDLHLKAHAPQHTVQYICSTCNRKFKTKTGLSVHEYKNHDAALESLTNLIPEPIVINAEQPHQQSEQITSEESKDSCKQCGLSCISHEDLQKHENQHELHKRHKCRTCGRSFTSKLLLRTHQKSHLNKCVYCPRMFKSKAHCKTHMQNHLRQLLGNNKADSATNTDFSSTSVKTVKAQVLVQELMPNNRTTAKFIEIEMLQKHEHRNIQVEKLDQQLTELQPADTQSIASRTCTHCLKQFQKPSDLIRHLRTHSAERPFACEQCAKCFKLKSTLEDHAKTHLTVTERNKFDCQVCGKLYASSKSLAVHLRLHTGTLPFKCDFCDKCFRTSGHRLSHMKAAKAANGQCRQETSNIMY